MTPEETLVLHASLWLLAAGVVMCVVHKWYAHKKKNKQLSDREQQFEYELGVHLEEERMREG